MKNNRILPVGLKGNQINERMMELMGINQINENKSNIAVELTKMGRDGKAYAIIRENHEYYIKFSDKTFNILAEDFKYIGGLQNKKAEAYPSYAKAIKHLNLKFNSLAEAYNNLGVINVFLDDNLLNEDITGFSQYQGNGFSDQSNMEGGESLFEEENTEETDDEDILTEYGKDPSDDVKGKASKRWDSDADDDKSDEDPNYKKGVHYYTDKHGDNHPIIGKGKSKNESIDYDNLSEEQKIIQNMISEDEDDENQHDEEENSKKHKEWQKKDREDNLKKYGDVFDKPAPIKEHRLSITRAMEKMDSIIDSLTEGKKKVYTLK